MRISDQHTSPAARRRSSPLQRLTLAAAVLLVAAQLLFLGLVALRPVPPIRPAEPVPTVTAEEPEEPAAVPAVAAPETTAAATSSVPTAEPARPEPEPAAAVTAAPPPEAAAEPGPEPGNALQETVNRLVQQAREARGEGRAAGALQRVEQALALEQAHTPALLLKAQLLEDQGDRAQAAALWTKLLANSGDTNLVLQARTALQRLQPEPQPQQPAPAAPAPHTILITEVEEEILPPSDDFSAMRLFHITMESHRRKPCPGNDVLVKMAFFDEDPDSGEVYPAGGVGPQSPLRLQGTWAPGARRRVTAAYLVPQTDGEEADPERRRYKGYILRVFYRQQLQDERVAPEDLIDRIKAFAVE